MEAYRQGDVLIVPIDEKELSKFKQNRGSGIQRERGEGLVLAEGEATGHAHRVRSRGARLRRHSVVAFGQRKQSYTCLSVPPEGAVVEHDEHEPIALSHGKYLVVRQSEYAPAVTERQASDSARTYVAD